MPFRAKEKFQRPLYLRRYISVKGEFAEKILSGRKVTTIRLGKVVPMSEEMIIQSGGKAIAKVRIEEVEMKRIGELTDEEARRDGFKSVRDLIKSLEKMYNVKVTKDDLVTIIRFEVIERMSQGLDKKDVYMGYEPGDIAALALVHYKKSMSEEERRVLEELARSNSIRATSYALFGNLNKRWLVRKILKRYFKMLLDQGIIAPLQGGEGRG